MKIGISLVILVCLMAITGLGVVYAEVIYTKAGEEIQAKIDERDGDIIWYESSGGEIVEYTGIDIAEVEKVLNDDGSVSDYSPER